MRMQPIFLALCAVSFLLLGYTFQLGRTYHLGSATGPDGEVVAVQSADGAGAPEGAFGWGLLGTHFVMGIASGIFVCFVHSIVLVYFLGTGKAIKEQMELQNWAEEPYERSRKIMGQSLMPATAGIVLVIIAAFSGGFSLIQVADPDVHMLIAACGIMGQIPVYARQWTLIRENGRLMDEVVERLGGDDIRIARRTSPPPN